MAILIDYSQVAISSIMGQANSKHFDGELNVDLVRHMILNGIRHFNQQFKEKYGDLVICCDDKNYWRKQIFPYYKAHRKADREASNFDWKTIFECLDTVKQELRDFFPYKVLQIETAEADDIIATLIKFHASPLEGGFDFEPCVIVSGDKDFIQLHRWGDVSQWSPVQSKWVRGNPDKYLREHILKGDRGDGIPNVLSKDDVFVSGSRQTPLRQKKIEEILADLDEGELLYAANCIKVIVEINS
jgi:5'-3' exonuclease